MKKIIIGLILIMGIWINANADNTLNAFVEYAIAHGDYPSNVSQTVIIKRVIFKSESDELYDINKKMHYHQEQLYKQYQNKVRQYRNKIWQYIQNFSYDDIIFKLGIPIREAKGNHTIIVEYFINFNLVNITFKNKIIAKVNNIPLLYTKLSGQDYEFWAIDSKDPHIRRLQQDYVEKHPNIKEDNK
jgi:hypothetical protein